MKSKKIILWAALIGIIIWLILSITQEPELWLSYSIGGACGLAIVIFLLYRELKR
jgi:uncharacterized membrane protein